MVALIVVAAFDVIEALPVFVGASVVARVSVVVVGVSVVVVGASVVVAGL